MFNVQPELPDEVAVFNTTAFLPSYVDPLPNSFVEQVTQYSDPMNAEIDFVSLRPNSMLTVIFSLPVVVTANSTNRTVILAASKVDYAYTLFERVFSFADTFHDVYLTNLKMAFSLVSTSLELTNRNIITFNEIATWHVAILDIVGPAQNMTVNIASRNVILSITGLSVLLTG